MSGVLEQPGTRPIAHLGSRQGAHLGEGPEVSGFDLLPCPGSVSDVRLVKKWKALSNGRPFLLKGIQCAEDAVKAMEHGCDGVVVSNHAGRQVDGAVGSLDMLPEVSNRNRAWAIAS